MTSKLIKACLSELLISLLELWRLATRCSFSLCSKMMKYRSPHNAHHQLLLIMLLFYVVVREKNQIISVFASNKGKMLKTITTANPLWRQPLVCKWMSYFLFRCGTFPSHRPSSSIVRASLHQCRPVLTCSKECASSGQKIYDPQLWRWTNNACLYLSILSYSCFKLVIISSWFSENWGFFLPLLMLSLKSNIPADIFGLH